MLPVSAALAGRAVAAAVLALLPRCSLVLAVLVAEGVAAAEPVQSPLMGDPYGHGLLLACCSSDCCRLLLNFTAVCWWDCGSLLPIESCWH